MIEYDTDARIEFLTGVLRGLKQQVVAYEKEVERLKAVKAEQTGNLFDFVDAGLFSPEAIQKLRELSEQPVIELANKEINTPKRGRVTMTIETVQGSPAKANHFIPHPELVRPLKVDKNIE